MTLKLLTPITGSTEYISKDDPSYYDSSGFKGRRYKGSPKPKDIPTFLWRGSSKAGIKSDSETSPDCATRIAQLFGRIAQLGLRNSQDCATPGLRNSACATNFDTFRNSQDCATLWSDCATWRNYCRQIAQLPGLCNSLVGLRNYFRQIAQLPGLRNSLVGLRNYFRQIAQLPGLRNSSVKLRNY